MQPDEPRVGELYSCEEQSGLHGGNPQQTLPERDGEVTLIRFRLDKNPDGPHNIDHGDQRRLRERIEMLRRQRGPLPVYMRVGSAAWEYLGRYRVQSITNDARETVERSWVTGRPSALSYSWRRQLSVPTELTIVTGD